MCPLSLVRAGEISRLWWRYGFGAVYKYKGGGDNHVTATIRIWRNEECRISFLPWCEKRMFLFVFWVVLTPVAKMSKPLCMVFFFPPQTENCSHLDKFSTLKREICQFAILVPSHFPAVFRVKSGKIIIIFFLFFCSLTMRPCCSCGSPLQTSVVETWD